MSATELESASLPLRGLSWPGVELRHLIAFRAVVDEGSFARAALSLGYTQGAISQQIASLERAIGRRLLDRPGGRGRPTLTPAGEIVLAHAHAIARELTLARATLERLDCASAESPLRVGMRHETGLLHFPLIVERLADGSVGLLRLFELRTDRELVELVSFGEIDLAFVEDAPADLASIDVLSEPYVAVTSLARARTLPESLSPDALAGQPLLLLRSSLDSGESSQLFRGLNASLLPAFEADQPGLLCDLASRGQGIAIVPRSLAQSSARTAVIEIVDPPERRVIAIWRRNGTRAGELRDQFVEAAASVFRI
jgi:DNA-binding transcriptional LysR family regulator